MFEYILEEHDLKEGQLRLLVACPVADRVYDRETLGADDERSRVDAHILEQLRTTSPDALALRAVNPKSDARLSFAEVGAVEVDELCFALVRGQLSTWEEVSGLGVRKIFHTDFAHYASALRAAVQRIAATLCDKGDAASLETARTLRWMVRFSGAGYERVLQSSILPELRLERVYARRPHLGPFT